MLGHIVLQYCRISGYPCVCFPPSRLLHAPAAGSWVGASDVCAGGGAATLAHAARSQTKGCRTHPVPVNLARIHTSVSQAARPPASDITRICISSPLLPSSSSSGEEEGVTSAVCGCAPNGLAGRSRSTHVPCTLSSSNRTLRPIDDGQPGHQPMTRPLRSPREFTTHHAV